LTFGQELDVPLSRIHKNKEVITTGKHYETLFINRDGWLSKYKILHSGDRQILDFILPGQIFGLQACLFNASLYSVATVTDVSLSAIPFDIIERMFERSPKLGKALFCSAAREAAILGEHLIDTARRSAYERISHLLLELFVRSRAAGLAENMSFQMPLTQELIGDAVGLTTVHVNRTLRLLRDDKLIAINGKRITILDFEAMSLLCDFENSYLGETAHALAKEMKSSRMDGALQSKRAEQPGSV
jgi:CRP-like cAMP-binding protein